LQRLYRYIFQESHKRTLATMRKIGMYFCTEKASYRKPFIVKIISVRFNIKNVEYIVH